MKLLLLPHLPLRTNILQIVHQRIFRRRRHGKSIRRRKVLHPTVLTVPFTPELSMSGLSVGSFAWFGPVRGGRLSHGFKVNGDFPVCEGGTRTMRLRTLIAGGEDDVFFSGDELDWWEGDGGDWERGFCG